MTARTLMIQGTSSSVGKSLLVAALCRIFARRGVRVAPFKAQNMSNNAAVCADGSEIGRSQQLQAAAAGIDPTADMNPVLLKPEADARSQVIVEGRPWRTQTVRAYFSSRQELWPIVVAALERLRQAYELVILEGAGSPAECNLRDVEIVNMAVARHACSPVVLIGDIERGGVFAQLLGTLWLLSDQDRALVRGLIVNKFRGDASLFDGGVKFLEERGGVPVLGVVPWLQGLDLPEEDAVALDDAYAAELNAETELDIAVIRLPRIANFDDFDPLAAEPGTRVRFVDAPNRLGQPSAIILPGTKSTMDDLHWLRDVGLAEPIVEYARRGVPVVGICGGYQMLGETLRDPLRIESSWAETAGLGLLPTETVFAPTKQTNQVRAVVRDDRHCPGSRGRTVEGYEIHLGQTIGPRPWLRISHRGEVVVEADDGAISEDGRIWGCYLHGLFANDFFRRAWLDSLRGGKGGTVAFPNGQATSGGQTGTAARIEQSLNRLADCIENAIDMKKLEQIVWNAAGKEQTSEMADLVTEMRMVKHPFRDGIKPQRGIEF